ncbi:MAG: DUF3391 domain-containing protein [Alteromonadaceae bacterium]|nr:DUF3391 domain-containing protein [Alteromonadaceae bacterium]
MSQYQTVTIDELQTGMFVEAVAKQTGNLKIKSQGKVSSENVIEWLRRQGILELVVDVSKGAEETSSKPANDEANSTNKATSGDKNSPKKFVDLQLEIRRATELHKNAQNIQKRLFIAAQKGIKFNLNATQKVADAVVESLNRNPNALLCMTQIRAKGGYLFEHSVNCGVLMAAFAKSMGFDDKLVWDLTFSGLVHDLGMVKVPSRILNKDGKLDAAEQKVVREHVRNSIALLKPFKEVSETVFRTIRCHHERLDGTGYPLGLDGDNINQYSRMLAIVDTYDAMIAERSYKKPILAANALKLLLKYSETQFDRDLVCKFIKCVGVYPIGSLVKLKSEKVGVVVDLNEAKPFKPKINVFYSTRSNHFLPKRDIDLATGHSAEEILEPTSAKVNRINYKRFFMEQMQVA